MSEPKRPLKSRKPGLFLLAAVILMIVLVVVMKVALGAVFLAILGFGAIVFFHELGHFTSAKLTGIKVETFSLGFSPVLASIKRVSNGYLIKVLPKKEQEGQLSGSASFTIPAKCTEGETEYRIGMIPFGGYVKMLGQDDTKVSNTDDPRAYPNKPIWARMIVIASGVICNFIMAGILFITVFMHGVNLMPPVVGDVEYDSPAYHAGLEAGDEIIKIDSRTDNLQFMHLAESAVFAGKGTTVPMTVRKHDGSIVQIEITPRKKPGGILPSFGIASPMSLIIMDVEPEDAALMKERTNLQPGDEIIGVNGIEVNNYVDLATELSEVYDEKVILLARRQVGKETKMIEAEIPLGYGPGVVDGNETQLSSICSIVPLLKVTDSEHVKYVKDSPEIDVGDVIKQVGDVNYPTYAEMREVTKKFSGQAMPMVLARDGEDYETKVMPWDSDGRVLIGIGIALEMEQPYVAKLLGGGEEGDSENIPRGAKITAVNRSPVANYFDIIRSLKVLDGQKVLLSLEPEHGGSGEAQLKVHTDEINVASGLAEVVPLAPLERTYKADSPSGAIKMGFQETINFIRHAALTLRAFVAGRVSAKSFMGPVGIAKISYEIVKTQPFIYYVYWIALINSFIAVFNSLPFLPFDGGHIVILAIEKVRGKPLEERIQAGLIYVGLFLVLAFALYVTFNDVVRFFVPLL